MIFCYLILGLFNNLLVDKYVMSVKKSCLKFVGGSIIKIWYQNYLIKNLKSNFTWGMH